MGSWRESPCFQGEWSLYMKIALYHKENVFEVVCLVVIKDLH